jgi:hypothetical protein
MRDGGKKWYGSTPEIAAAHGREEHEDQAEEEDEEADQDAVGDGSVDVGVEPAWGSSLSLPPPPSPPTPPPSLRLMSVNSLSSPEIRSP